VRLPGTPWLPRFRASPAAGRSSPRRSSAWPVAEPLCLIHWSARLAAERSYQTHWAARPAAERSRRSHWAAPQPGEGSYRTPWIAWAAAGTAIRRRPDAETRRKPLELDLISLADRAPSAQGTRPMRPPLSAPGCWLRARWISARSREPRLAASDDPADAAHRSRAAWLRPCRCCPGSPAAYFANSPPNPRVDARRDPGAALRILREPRRLTNFAVFLSAANEIRRICRIPQA
jgi:hypothetical protein